MSNNRYLVIDNKGIVQNAIVWDGATEWHPPEGCRAVELGDDEYYEFGKPRGIKPPAQTDG
jgi:hypothetical protein